jgi:hypothetical protein
MLDTNTNIYRYHVLLNREAFASWNDENSVFEFRFRALGFLNSAASVTIEQEQNILKVARVV